MSRQNIKILQLYPREMNIYGDWGNVLTLKKRLQWRGYGVDIVEHHPGGIFPPEVDLVVGGGGQDAGQDKVTADLLKIATHLHALAELDVPMLMVCGLYQLFGRFFKAQDGHVVEGIGVFKLETIAGPKRLIGNVVTKSKFGEIIGYENHSGLTYLDADQTPLGRVIKGAGNNGKDKTEGAIYKNVIGTYLHGSLLPKNPVLADYLIEQAVTRKYGQFNPHRLDTILANKARQIAKKRPR